MRRAVLVWIATSAAGALLSPLTAQDEELRQRLREVLQGGAYELSLPPIGDGAPRPAGEGPGEAGETGVGELGRPGGGGRGEAPREGSTGGGGRAPALEGGGRDGDRRQSAASGSDPEDSERAGPGAPAEPPPQPPPASRPSSALPAVLGAGGSAVANLLVWVLSVVAVALVAIAVVRFLGRERDAEAAVRADTGETGGAPVPPDREGLPDPERLAAEERFGEAVHALLLHSVTLLSRPTASPPPLSLTGRELIELLPRSPAVGEALAAMVRSVELWLFGGRSLSAAEYQANLEHFRLISRAGR